MKLKQILITAVVALLAAALAVGGTLAYLQDTDSDVNVMVVGNVLIDQIEQERDANGNLVDFTQAKPAIPAVFADGTGSIQWDDEKLDFNGTGYLVFDDSMKNVVDKFVTVKNTGKNDAYFRTLVAIEDPNLTFDGLVHVNLNDDDYTHQWLLDGNAPLLVDIDGTNYTILTLVHNEILKPGQISAPSFLQTFINPKATAEDLAALNGLWDIKVISQAIQADGFSDANAALNAGFGAVTADNAKAWFGGLGNPVLENPKNDNEFEAAVKGDEKQIVVNLTGDVTYDVAAWAVDAMGSENTEMIVINGNGHTITFNQTNSDWNNITTNGAKLVINDAKLTSTGYNNGPWNRHDLNFACQVELNNVTTDKAIALKAGARLTNVTINDANTSDTYAIWIQPNGQTVTLSGCTIDMLACSDGRGIKIDEQYVADPAKVTLQVSNTTFKTEEKSAILVKSVAGADVILSNVDISGVAADTVNPVWVDEASAAYADLVTVTGGSKILEP